MLGAPQKRPTEVSLYCYGKPRIYWLREMGYEPTPDRCKTTVTATKILQGFSQPLYKSTT